MPGLFQEEGAIPASAGADAGDDADDHGQHHELRRRQPLVIAGDGHQMQQLACQELPANDVEEVGDRHQGDAGYHPPGIHVGGAQEDQQQRKADVNGHTNQQHRHRDGKAGPHALTDVVANLPPVVRALEAEGDKADGFL